MKTSILLAVLFVATGMSCSHLKRGDTSASNFRMFWVTEGFEFESATNRTSIRLQRSNPDAESLKAVAEGAAKGAVKGVAP